MIFRYLIKENLLIRCLRREFNKIHSVHDKNFYSQAHELKVVIIFANLRTSVIAKIYAKNSVNTFVIPRQELVRSLGLQILSPNGLFVKNQ